jgi:branched-chain amino acid transport system substrate-binding protein
VISVFTAMWGQLDTNKQVGGLFPNDGDGNAWGDPNVGFPPVLTSLATPDRSGPLPEPDRRFLGPDQRLQAGQCRNRHRRSDPAGFHHLLDQAKQQGFTPKAASIGKAILFPQAVEALGDAATTCPRKSGGRRAIRSSPRSPASAPVKSRAYTRQRPAASGPSPSALSMRCSSWPSMSWAGSDDAGDGDAVAEAIAASNLEHHGRPDRV